MYKIFDVHTHVYPEKIARKAVDSLCAFYRFSADGTGTFYDMLRREAEYNLQGFLILSVATNEKQVEHVNTFACDTVREARERGFAAFAFAAMHQDYPDMETEYRRIKAAGMKGIKLHPDLQRVDIDSEKMYPLYEMAEGNLPIYFHMGDERREYQYSRPEKLKKVLADFPRLTVVAAHLGGYRIYDTASALLCKEENVWFDTSSSLWELSSEDAARIIRRLPQDRLMFGTDYPVRSLREEMELFMHLDLTDRQRENILYYNAAHFLGV